MDRISTGTGKSKDPECRCAQAIQRAILYKFTNTVTKSTS